MVWSYQLSAITSWVWLVFWWIDFPSLQSCRFPSWGRYYPLCYSDFLVSLGLIKRIQSLFFPLLGFPTYQCSYEALSHVELFSFFWWERDSGYFLRANSTYSFPTSAKVKKFLHSHIFVNKTFQVSKLFVVNIFQGSLIFKDFFSCDSSSRRALVRPFVRSSVTIV